jgi:hypothetical protein
VSSPKKKHHAARSAASGSESLAPSAYVPPPEVRAQLGRIVDLLPNATVVPGARLKEVFFAYVPTAGRVTMSEVLFFQTTRLDLDTDGNTDSWGKTASEGRSHQGMTSLDRHAHSRSLAASNAAHEENPDAPRLPVDDATTDSNVTPYFVLPLRDAQTDSDWVGKDRGIALGDVGVIVGKNRVVFAQFADAGPSNKLGEASLAVHRKFGQDDITGRARVLNTDLEGPFVTIVFPGSAPAGLRSNPVDIATTASALFALLGGMA